jgi:hypothetical protein
LGCERPGRLAPGLLAEQHAPTVRGAPDLHVIYGWLEVGKLIHHAVLRLQIFPGGWSNCPELAAYAERVRSLQGGNGIVSALLSLALKSRFLAAASLSPETGFECQPTAQEVRGCCAAGTTRRACPRGGPLPFQEEAGAFTRSSNDLHVRRTRQSSLKASRRSGVHAEGRSK